MVRLRPFFFTTKGLAGQGLMKAKPRDRMPENGKTEENDEQ
jgi:hypothetical protein